MTVNELIEQLQAMQSNGNGEMEVQFAYNYGDYWRTQVAATIDTVDTAQVKYSDYHSMDKVVDQERFDEDDGEVVVAEDTRTVVMLG